MMSGDHAKLPQFEHDSALSMPGSSGKLEDNSSGVRDRFRAYRDADHRRSARRGAGQSRIENSMAQDARPQQGQTESQGSHQPGSMPMPVQQQAQTTPQRQITDLASI
jgi:hypothetical protein